MLETEVRMELPDNRIPWIQDVDTVIKIYYMYAQCAWDDQQQQINTKMHLVQREQDFSCHTHEKTVPSELFTT